MFSYRTTIKVIRGKHLQIQFSCESLISLETFIESLNYGLKSELLNRALNDCWRFDLNSTEWTKIKLKITETAQSPKSELQLRLGPNRRHSLGASPLELTRDSMKYMRMWHTAFFNKFNGKMMICGGTNSQNEFYKNLPPVFLLQSKLSF